MAEHEVSSTVESIVDQLRALNWAGDEYACERSTGIVFKWLVPGTDSDKLCEDVVAAIGDSANSEAFRVGCAYVLGTILWRGGRASVTVLEWVERIGLDLDVPIHVRKRLLESLAHPATEYSRDERDCAIAVMRRLCSAMSDVLSARALANVSNVINRLECPIDVEAAFREFDEKYRHKR